MPLRAGAQSPTWVQGSSGHCWGGAVLPTADVGTRRAPQPAGALTPARSTAMRPRDRRSAPSALEPCLPSVQPRRQGGALLLSQTRRAHAHPEAVPLLPSRSPCRPCPRLSARPRRGAAGTAREGWGTPGERCPCRTRGKRRSTLEKRRSTSGTPRGSSHGRRKRSRPSSNSVPTEAQGPRPG